MKKIYIFLFLSLLFCFVLTGCSNTSVEETTNSTAKNTTETTSIIGVESTVTTEKVNNNDYESTVTTETTSNITTVEPTVTTETTVVTTEQQTQPTTTENVVTTTNVTTTTQKNNGNTLISDEDLEKIENSNAEVYFSDNPNNKSIVAVSDKYGVKKENLIALVKVNAEFPSAMVFEFSGKRDNNGELVMTYAELQNVYDINEETNVIVKASKNGFNNDGLNFVESKVYMMLAKEYFIPELPNLKENKRYHD